ncbi:MAG: hypothetical protein P4L81_07030, partial [Candidatus Pacebacteria bacterium]|nr:hypothetical protein [Candidatus Paceibacterota bacterium]
MVGAANVEHAYRSHLINSAFIRHRYMEALGSPRIATPRLAIALDVAIVVNVGVRASRSFGGPIAIGSLLRSRVGVERPQRAFEKLAIVREQKLILRLILLLCVGPWVTKAREPNLVELERIARSSRLSVSR